MILAGDVGGTKVHLALYNMVEGRLILVRDFKFPAHEFASLEDVVHRFLTNDLEANGFGIRQLAPDQICTLHKGDPAATGHQGLIAAGTGLGEALLIWAG